MSNAYFDFKQFTIHQDRCAMKVCTDACILGAWFAPKIPDVAAVLDMGAGTGLLMMMLAQKSAAMIHGIEIDEGAYQQAIENTSRSKWKNRFKLFKGDVRSFEFPMKYDFIICNPPFHENDLPADSKEKNIARHSLHLNLKELLASVNKNLLPHGSFGVLIVPSRVSELIDWAASYKMYPVEKLSVHQTKMHQPFRTILHFSRHKENFIPEFELIIQRDNGLYTHDFSDLMRDYYL